MRQQRTVTISLPPALSKQVDSLAPGAREIHKGAYGGAGEVPNRRSTAQESRRVDEHCGHEGKPLNTRSAASPRPAEELRLIKSPSSGE